MSALTKQFAHVAIGLPLEGHFDYEVPPQWQANVSVGVRVWVPFGRRKVLGYVVGVSDFTMLPAARVKALYAVLDACPVFGEATLALAREVSARYGCSLGEALDLQLPTAVRRGRKLPTISAFSPSFGEQITQISNEISGAGEHQVTNALLYQTSEKQVEVFHALGQSVWGPLTERVRSTLAAGGQVVVVVPDWVHAAQAKARLAEAGVTNVSGFERRATEKEECEQWLAWLEGKISVLVGPRSYVFSPLPRGGLVVVVHEDSDQYREESAPFYHVREVALLRARGGNERVVLTSAVPSVELWHELEQGRAVSVVSAQPPEDRAVPVQLLDVTNYNTQGTTILSPPVLNAIHQALGAHEKVLLYFNRADADSLEQRLSQWFAPARVVQFNRRSGIPKNFDVVIATQAVFKPQFRHFFAASVLLGVDHELSRYDFRCGHRVLALIHHLEGLTKGKLFVQTQLPEHYCLRAAVKRDYALFYREELKLRRELNLPPFGALVTVVSRSPESPLALSQSEAIHDALTEAPLLGVHVSGPQPDRFAQLRQQYRFAVTLHGSERGVLLDAVKRALKKATKKTGVITTVQVD